jgi:hypothetical protein
MVTKTSPEGRADGAGREHKQDLEPDDVGPAVRPRAALRSRL